MVVLWHVNYILEGGVSFKTYPLTQASENYILNVIITYFLKGKDGRSKDKGTKRKYQNLLNICWMNEYAMKSF